MPPRLPRLSDAQRSALVKMIMKPSEETETMEREFEAHVAAIAAAELLDRHFTINLAKYISNSKALDKLKKYGHEKLNLRL